jgi:UrcA family protein
MNTQTTLDRFDLKTRVRTAAMLALSAMASATAVARSSGTPGITATASETVSVADLDLSTPAGMSAARDRVFKTARRLCFGLADPSELSHASNYVKCVDEAVATAMLQVTDRAHGVVAQSGAGQRNVR